MSRTTITKAIGELRGRGALITAMGRIRHEGAGRKRIEESDPEVKNLIVGIVEETTAGDPMSLLRWTGKSTRTIAEELARRGHRIDAVTVGRCLMSWATRCRRTSRQGGPQHPDRDAQFRYINRLVKAYVKAGEPVISVDTKKKELVGDFKNAGRSGGRRASRRGQRARLPASRVAARRSPTASTTSRATSGWVNVGIDHDTAEFAVESIRRWWQAMGGRRATRDAERLLITRRRRRQQRQPAAAVEGRSCRASPTSIGIADHGLPLPAGHQQVEQDRAPPVLVHHA